jgi:hypothetical protein
MDLASFVHGSNFSDYTCSICLKPNEDLEYTRPRDKMWYDVTCCCHSLVCSKCIMSKDQKHCCVCSSETKMGSVSKNVPDWKKKWEQYFMFNYMWKTKPLLGPFCATYFNGSSWREYVRIIQDGNRDQIEALEMQYRSFVRKTLKNQYMFFTFTASFQFWPVVRQPLQMQSWYSVLQDTRQYIIRRRNLLKMFQNGFVKMLGKKFSEEKVVTELGEEINFRRRFFLRILTRFLQKRHL